MKKIILATIIFSSSVFAGPKIRGKIDAEGNLIMWVYGGGNMVANPGETIVEDLPRGLSPMDRDTNTCSRLVAGQWITTNRVIVKAAGTIALEQAFISDMEDFNTRFTSHPDTPLPTKPTGDLEKRVFKVVAETKSQGKMNANQRNARVDIEDTKKALLAHYAEAYFRAAWLIDQQGDAFGTPVSAVGP